MYPGVVMDKFRLVYVVVENNEPAGTSQSSSRCRLVKPKYSRATLTSTLQLMGCKARHAYKISDRAFEIWAEKSGFPHLAAQVKSGCPPAFPPASKPRPAPIAAQSSARFPSLPNSGSKHVALDSGGKNGSQASAAVLGAADASPAGASSPSASAVCKVGAAEGGSAKATAVVSRDIFLTVVCHALAEYHYVEPNQRADLVIACRVKEHRTSVTVLLCGTSGCGKSTLASLLASRLGITTVVSTDSIRHMMRGFVTESENPLLFASTYDAGERLDAVAVAEAKAKRRAKKAGLVYLGGCVEKVVPVSEKGRHGGPEPPTRTTSTTQKRIQTEGSAPSPEDGGAKGKGRGRSVVSRCRVQGGEEVVVSDVTISDKEMTIQGYKAQSEAVIDSLDRLISNWEERKESAVVEGVHLSLNFVGTEMQMNLMKRHPTIVPFMVFIANEDKHLERFAVRAKYMTLDPARNKYAKYIKNIRAIQEYLCKRADKHLVPKVNNTNVDKSVAAIHATVFASLQRQALGGSLYDASSNRVSAVQEEYARQHAAMGMSSKGMFQLLHSRPPHPTSEKQGDGAGAGSGSGSGARTGDGNGDGDGEGGGEASGAPRAGAVTGAGAGMGMDVHPLTSPTRATSSAVPGGTLLGLAVEVGSPVSSPQGVMSRTSSPGSLNVRFGSGCSTSYEGSSGGAGPSWFFGSTSGGESHTHSSDSAAEKQPMGEEVDMVAASESDDEEDMNGGSEGSLSGDKGGGEDKEYVFGEVEEGSVEEEGSMLQSEDELRSGEEQDLEDGWFEPPDEEADEDFYRTPLPSSAAADMVFDLRIHGEVQAPPLSGMGECRERVADAEASEAGGGVERKVLFKCVSTPALSEHARKAPQSEGGMRRSRSRRRNADKNGSPLLPGGRSRKGGVATPGVVKEVERASETNSESKRREGGRERSNRVGKPTYPFTTSLPTSTGI